MIGKRKKPSGPARAPHLNQSKQTTFRYTSNRSQSDRPLARQDVEKSTKKQAHHERILQLFRQVPIAIGAAVVVVACVYLSLLTAQPTVVFRGDQQSIREGTPYATFANELTDNIQGKSKLTINRQKIADELQNKYPELETIEVKTPVWSNKVTIEAKVSKPSILLVNGSQDFVVDNRGVVLLNASKERPTIKIDELIKITDQSNARIDIGKQALTSAHITFIRELQRQAAEKQLAIESSNLSAGAGELHVKHATTGYFVKYNLNEDARKSFGTYLATKERIDQTNVKPAEYVDVRIPERAYVK